MNVLSHPFTVRRADLRIKASDILGACTQPTTELYKIRREFRRCSDTVYSFNYRGTYVDFWIGVELCRRYGLTELAKELRTWKDVQQEPVKEPETSEPAIAISGLLDFIEIGDFDSPILVGMPAFGINASHIAKLAGRSEKVVANLRDRLGSNAYTMLWGGKKRQGTYVNFSNGVGLCREYGLHGLEERLYSLKRNTEGLASEAEPTHFGSQGQTLRRLPESPGSDCTHIRRTWNQERPRKSLGGPITNEPMEAEDAHEMDSGSDVAGSRGSITTCEPHSIQQELRPVPSIPYAKDPASSRQSGRDTRYSLLELPDPHLNPAKSVQYEVWDSRLLISKLTEVEPDLRPSTGNATSHYGSFSDLFAPP